MKPAIICNDHGFVELSDEDYQVQLAAADDVWKCPICGESAAFDDESVEPPLVCDDSEDDYEAPAF